jgi:hypothetical protein
MPGDAQLSSGLSAPAAWRLTIEQAQLRRIVDVPQGEALNLPDFAGWAEPLCSRG